MDQFTILFLIGAVIIGPVILSIVLRQREIGSPLAAGTLAVAFGAFTVFTVAREGLARVVFNHNLNFWGTQVWYDLIIAVSIALFFIAPRARAVGMAIWPWAIFVALTASIGLLAMIARLFWLERKDAAQT